MSEALSFSSRFPGSSKAPPPPRNGCIASAPRPPAGKLVFAIEVCLEELSHQCCPVRCRWHRDGCLPRRRAHLQVAPDIALVVEDNARPFDVSAAPVRPIAAEVAQVQPGGLAWHCCADQPGPSPRGPAARQPRHRNFLASRGARP